MKLWIKLSIILVIIINFVIEIGLMYITPKVEDFSVDLVGEKLKSIAASISASIDGDQFKEINIFDSSSVNSSSYLNTLKTIQQAKENLELSDELFTITILDRNSISFGVVLNRITSSKDTLQEISLEARKAIEEVYQKKHCEYTPMYEDKYGSWLSGFAPIYDYEKNVVGVVQVDQKFEDVLNRISEINIPIQIGRLYSIPITLMISIFFAAVFVRPIRKVKEKITRIANGDYSTNEEIKSGGEVKELVLAAENLRTIILEQQDKIFQNIKELERAKNKAESSDKLKSEFLAVISHEIRTPLNVILGNIEVLKLELDEDKIAELEDILNPIRIGSERLIRTVEMMVLYSELSSNSYVLREQYVDINELFFTVVEKHKNIAAEKGIRINFDCTAATGIVKTDERLLEEAINQIADNAVKYTKEGEISFCIQNTDDSGIKLLVKDTGIGISSDFMKELFKPFRQEDMSYERRFEGNGIGLALAKKCCNQIGFDLEIVSSKDEGTEVTINIGKGKLFND